MVLCEKCSFENYDGTKFCQKCGEKLSYKKSIKKFLKNANLNGLAGMGMKGVSLAPLAGKNTTIKKSNHVKTVALEDGSWYCPDCGKHNSPFTSFCSGCGRDK